MNPSDVMHPLVFEAKKAIIELTGQFVSLHTEPGFPTCIDLYYNITG